MLKGSSTSSSEEQPLQRPKNLTEAYKTVLTERTAFFAKTISSDEDLNVDSSFKQLGVIEDDKEATSVKNKIRSFSILKTTQDLLKSAGWANDNPILNAKEFGQLIFEHNIDVEDLANIVSNRNNLKHFEQIITKTGDISKFDLFDEIYLGLEPFAKKTSKESFLSLFSDIVSRQGTIDGTNVGPGEFVISLFTNSAKPSTEDKEKGDLKFGSAKVEVKQSSISKEAQISGAKLGYAFHAMEYVRPTMQKLLMQLKSPPYARLTKQLSLFQDKVDDLKAQNIFGSNVYTDKLANALSTFDQFFLKLDPDGFEKHVKTLFNIDIKGVRLTQQLVSSTSNFLVKHGYVNSEINTNDVKTRESITVGLVSLLRNGIASVKDLSDRSSTNQKWDDMSLTVAVNEFFLSDLGFTSEQLTDALYQMHPFDMVANSGLKEDIKSALDQGYLNKLKRGDEKALRGLVFAIHLSEYARHEDFNFLLLINRSTKQSISIPTPANGFKELLSLYDAKGESDFYFRIDLASRQGAHTISIR